MNPKLKQRRIDIEPKCATCGWWQGGHGPSGTCDLNAIKTLDLATCTGWRDGDTEQEILNPEGEE